MSRRAGRFVDDLLDTLPRLALVAGKGGVGKTTCAAALALRSAERGARTLLLSTDPAGTLADALRVPLGPDPQPVDASAATLDAFQVDARAERERFLARWRATIVTIIDRGTYLDADDIAGFVDAAMPGADEIFAMLRLGELERDTDYTRVIVDTAPTGHTLRLLDLPRTFAATVALLEAMQSKHRFMVRALTRAYRADAADAFLDEMRERTAGLVSTLGDAGRAAALVVARPEPLVVAETERYVAELGAARIHVAALVANATDAATPMEDLRAVAPSVPLFIVPRLAEPPVGVGGLRRWARQVRLSAASSRLSASTRPAGSARPAAARTRPRAESPDPRAQTPAHRLLAPSLTIVGGKGGVGKTTAACALAIEAADLVAPVLLVSTDPAPSVADALAQPILDAETDVVGVAGLAARQMDATAAFREFQRDYQERVDAVFDAFVRRGVDAAADRAILRDLLALAPPGIDELYALTLLGETLEAGRFARIIVDPAPTGHLLRLLQLPDLALEWTHRLMRLMLKYREVTGLGETAEELLTFARRTRRLGELLRDPARAGLVVVALDEPLVRAETARLVDAVRAEGVRVRAVLWNRAPERWSLSPLPVIPTPAQFVAPAETPPPVGVEALRAWARAWMDASAESREPRADSP